MCSSGVVKQNKLYFTLQGRKPVTAIHRQGIVYMYHDTDKILLITAFVTPVVEYWLEREVAQWGFQTNYISQPLLHQL